MGRDCFAVMEMHVGNGRINYRRIYYYEDVHLKMAKMINLMYMVK